MRSITQITTDGSPLANEAAPALKAISAKFGVPMIRALVHAGITARFYDVSGGVRVHLEAIERPAPLELKRAKAMQPGAYAVTHPKTPDGSAAWIWYNDPAGSTHIRKVSIEELEEPYPVAGEAFTISSAASLDAIQTEAAADRGDDQRGR